MTVAELEQHLGVSPATIRRDLAELERGGHLRRTHGGAIPATVENWQLPDEHRATLNLEPKRCIAVTTESMIRDGERVFLDAGTTSLEVARRLCERQDLTFLTNGLGIANLLEGARREFTLVGGTFCAHNRSFVGALACRAIESFHVDTAILSTSGVNVDRAVITMPQAEMSSVQRSMMAIADRIIVVADHTKFSNAAFSVSAELSEIDLIITDDAATEGLDARIALAGSQLVRATRLPI